MTLLGSLWSAYIFKKKFFVEDFSAHGINDFIHLPVTDEKMNQVLLKWAGQKLSEGKY